MTITSSDKAECVRLCDVMAAYRRQHMEAECKRFATMIRDAELERRIRENHDEIGRLIEQCFGQTGAPWMSTQNRITELFAENDRLNAELFGGAVALATKAKEQGR